MILKFLVSVCVFTCVWAFEGLGDIHDEKYFCPDNNNNNNNVNSQKGIPSERRILLISPQKNYLSNRSSLMIFT